MHEESQVDAHRQPGFLGVRISTVRSCCTCNTRLSDSTAEVLFLLNNLGDPRRIIIVPEGSWSLSLSLFLYLYLYLSSYLSFSPCVEIQQVENAGRGNSSLDLWPSSSSLLLFAGYEMKFLDICARWGCWRFTRGKFKSVLLRWTRNTWNESDDPYHGRGNYHNCNWRRVGERHSILCSLIRD